MADAPTLHAVVVRGLAVAQGDSVVLVQAMTAVTAVGDYGDGHQTLQRNHVAVGSETGRPQPVHAASTRFLAGEV